MCNIAEATPGTWATSPTLQAPFNRNDVPQLNYASVRNLRIVSASTGTTSAISFDEAILKSANGRLIKLGSNSFTLTPASSGVNGLDTGSLAANWYNVYIINNGNTTASLISLSTTAPTLPAGYSYFALVGAIQVVSTGPTNLLGSIQIDNRVTTQDYGALAVPGVAATTGGVFQTLSLVTFVPSIAKTISGFMGAVATKDSAMAISPDGSDIGRINANAVAIGGAGYNGFGATVPFSDFILKTSQSLYWMSADNVQRNILYISGFTI
jgi:hypothetical protein